MSDLVTRLRDTLGDGYRIERELGGGGMSSVFLAEEVRLGRRVVIKVLAPELAAGVNAERFEREIRLAARLQHPHIVPLLTAGGEGDLLYYIMPYIEGESLRARLAREGELPVEDSIRVLRGVLDALSYAHAQGIVHRDIKPENILLAGRHALVTDFGVAKALAADGDAGLTGVGFALGTPSYMAPEQAVGDPNTDHRADLYAVGVMAYEMLSGRLPFEGTSAQALLAAQVTEAPTPLGKHRPSLPPAVSDAVMRLLSKRPADRFQQADDVSALMESVWTPSPTGTAAFGAFRPSPWQAVGAYAVAAVAAVMLAHLAVQQLGLPDWVFSGALILGVLGLPLTLGTAVAQNGRGGGMSRAVSWLTWRRLRGIGAAAFGLLVFAAAAHAAMRGLGIGPVGTLVAKGQFEAGALLVLAEFENRTDDATLGPSVTEALRIDLAQSPVVRMMSGAAVADALRRMERDPEDQLYAALAREVAQREGAAAVVIGEIAPMGRGYVLTARLLAAGDGREMVALRETAPDDASIISAVDRLSNQLRERIGESIRSIRAADRLESVTTASLEALRLYTAGVRAADAGDYQRGIRLLEEATQLDTTFAMAYRKLAVELSNSGGLAQRIREAATRAYTFRDRLPPLERHLATAYYFTVVQPDNDRAEAAYRAALEVDPRNLTALNNLGTVHMSRQQWGDAESLFRQALEVHSSWTLHSNLVHVQSAQGKYAAAESTLALLGENLPGHPGHLQLEAHIYGHRGDLAEAERIFRRVADSTDLDQRWREQAHQGMVHVLRLQGRIAESHVHVEQLSRLQERRGMPFARLNPRMDSSWVDLWYRGKREQAVGVIQDVQRVASIDTLQPLDRPYVGIGVQLSLAGRPDLARPLLEQMRREVERPMGGALPGSYILEGRIALAEDRPRDALHSFQRFREETHCDWCLAFEISQAYDRLEMPDSALAVLAHATGTPNSRGSLGNHEWLPLAYVRIGELHEARGERTEAIRAYNEFVELWNDADAEFQPRVREIRERIARLAAR